MFVNNTLKTMKKTSLIISLLAASQLHAVVIANENFDYANQDVETLNGGTGWGSAWGASPNATRRFVVSSNTALYQGGGSGTRTAQARTLSSSITVGVNDTLVVGFTLIRNETQGGRGIGMYLVNGGANQYFIGKAINEGVGLKSSIETASTDYTTDFASSSSSEAITATFTFDGTNTSIVLADSNETLTTYSQAGAFTFDGVSLAGYHQATTTNGIDSISVDLTTVPEPSSTALLGLGGLTLMLRRRK